MTSPLGFKARVDPSLTCFVHDMFLMFTSCAPPADLLASSMTADPRLRFLTYFLYFQIVDDMSRHLERKVKNVRRIFKVLHWMMYPEDRYLDSNATTVLAESRHRLIMLMGQEFYIALKTNKYITG